MIKERLILSWIEIIILIYLKRDATHIYKGTFLSILNQRATGSSSLENASKADHSTVITH